MKKIEIEPPVLLAIGATRAMMGVGIGLLLSRQVPPRKRKRLGWTLLALGAASTIPLAAHLLRRVR